MAKLILSDVGSLVNHESARETLNNNFTEIEQAVDELLSRDGATPNQMTADLDMNSKKIMNLADAVTDSEAVNVRTARVIAADAGSGDTAIRQDLAQTGAGKGASLVQYDADETVQQRLDAFVASTGSSLIGYLQSGTGAVARTMQSKVSDLYSVRDFGAVGDGVTDDTAAVQAAISALQGGNRSLLFPSGTYRIAGSLTCTGYLSMLSLGKFGAVLSKDTAGDLLTIGNGTLSGLVFNHDGPSGSTIVNTADNLHVLGCGFNPGAANADPVIVLKHANCIIDSPAITLSNSAQWAVDVVANTGNFCINGSIRGGTMYGNGNGIRFRSGTGGRPEGWDVTGMKIILTGATSVEVQSCLSVDVSGCTLDQSSGYCVKLVPTGSGIDALTIDDNYIATAQNTATGIGVGAVAGVGGIRSLSITNNHFELCGTACVLDSQMSGVQYAHNTSDNITTRHLDYAGAVAVSVAGNFMRGAVNLLRLIDGATGDQITVSGNSFDATGSVTYTPTDATRFEFSANTGKKFSGWGSAVSATIGSGSSSFLNVPHGLSVTPSVGKIVAQVKTESGGFLAPTANVVSVDATNVTLELFYTVASAGTLRGTVFCSA